MGANQQSVEPLLLHQQLLVKSNLLSPITYSLIYNLIYSLMRAHFPALFLNTIVR